MATKVPRGIRNNNPFNIKKSTADWIGKCNGDDKVFETFTSLEYGVRAGLKLLSNYISNGYDTPREILARFAPFIENDTESYLRFVCHDTIYSPDSHICVNTVDFFSLCSSIIKFENGFDDLILCKYQLSPVDLYSIYQKYFV